jgi:hypothetical protein
MCSNSLSKTSRRYPGSVSIPTAWLCSASLLARYPSSFHAHILLSHAQRSNTFSCATLEAVAVPNRRRRLLRLTSTQISGGAVQLAVDRLIRWWCGSILRRRCLVPLPRGLIQQWARPNAAAGSTTRACCSSGMGTARRRMDAASVAAAPPLSSPRRVGLGRSPSAAARSRPWLVGA